MTSLSVLIEQSFFLSEETKAKLLQALPTASAEVLLKIENLMNDAEQKQYRFLSVAVQNNPDLINELKEIYKKAVNQEREKLEKKAIEEEKILLEKLEKILEI